MPADAYTIALGIDLFDIDFFNTESSNENTFWKAFKGITRTISKMTLYVAAALLLTLLIYKSIRLIFATISDDPQKIAETKRILNNFIKSAFLISCIYLIMVLIMYGYNQLINLIASEDSNIYQLRLNVEDTYSFNTNVVGYAKYMTLKTNCGVGDALLYALAVVSSVAMFGIMFVRMLIISGLIIISPLTAVYLMIKRQTKEGVSTKNLLDVSFFMKYYIKVLCAPLIVIVVQKLVMYLA